MHSVRLDPVTGKEYAIRYEDVYKTPLSRRLVVLRKALNIEQEEFAEMFPPTEVKRTDSISANHHYLKKKNKKKKKK